MFETLQTSKETEKKPKRNTKNVNRNEKDSRSKKLLMFTFVDFLVGYCYLNKGECNLNQSKDDSFVKQVAKNNS